MGPLGQGQRWTAARKREVVLPPLPGRAPGSGFPGVGSRALPAGAMVGGRLGGHGRGPQVQKRRNPLQGRTEHGHAAHRRAHHGERTVMGPGEAPWPLNQKEVKKMSCTTSALAGRLYAVKLVCRIWGQPAHRTTWRPRPRGSQCDLSPPANADPKPRSLTPQSWN